MAKCVGLSWALFLAMCWQLPESAGGNRGENEHLTSMMDQFLSVGTEAYRQGDYAVAVRCFRAVARSSKDAGPSGPAMASHAQLFEGNAFAKAGKMRDAEARYMWAQAAIRGASVGTLSSMCKENLNHVRTLNRVAPPTWGARGERFLVFRFWAGLSNRRQELLGMIGAARILNRTLVLPPMVENRWMAAHKEDRPVQGVGHFYDMDVLSRYVPVIEQWDFVQRVVPALQLLPAELHIRDYQYIGQLAHLHLGWSDASLVDPTLIQKPRTPSEIAETFGASSAPVLAIDFSYRFVDFGFLGEFEFFDGFKEWTPRQVQAGFEPTPFHLEVLGSLTFHPIITSSAVLAIRKAGAEGRPFLGVHLRRNDMKNWSNRQHAWPSTDQVISQVLSLVQRFGVQHVFLATDADPGNPWTLDPHQGPILREERAALLSALPSTFEQPLDAALSEAQVALVDQAICSRARAFIGNFWSTFSLAIIEERSKMASGQAGEESNFFFQAPFEGARDGDVRPCGDASPT